MIKLIRTATIPGSFGLLKGQLDFLNKYFEVIALSGYDDKLEETGEREKVRIIDVSMERRISLYKDFVSLLKLYRVFKREKPTIVHSITPKAGLLTMVAGKMAGVPIRMHTFTGLIFPTRTGLMQQLLIKMDQLLCWAATNVYPEGYGVRQDLIDFKITSKPLKVIANGNVNGIDLEYFNPDNITNEDSVALRTSLGIKENNFVYLFVGRINRDKGINELVEAFVGAYDNTHNTQSNRSETEIPPQRGPHLVLVGPYERELDPLLPETERIIDTHPNIHAVGYKKNVIYYFAMADVLTFPSYREGFPNVVMQAAAMQLNAIVSDINGCNEIITNGDNGWIVPPKNVEQLQERMEWCMTNREESKDMGRKSRAVMVEKYERTYVWGEILKEYNKQLEAIPYVKK